ncbi:histidine kinase, partial [Streptomyces sp. NPDC059378]
GRPGGDLGVSRGRPAEPAPAGQDAAEGAVVMAGENAAGTAAAGTGLGGTVPPQGVPVGETVPAQGGSAPAGRRARRGAGEQHALPAALPAAVATDHEDEADGDEETGGRRRRALAAAAERAAQQEAAPRAVFALPPAEADRAIDGAAQGAQAGPVPALAQAPVPVPSPGPLPLPSGPVPAGDASLAHGRPDTAPHDHAEDHTPPQPHPTTAPTGRRRRAAGQSAEAAAVTGGVPQLVPQVPQQSAPPQPGAPQPVPTQGVPAQPLPAETASAAPAVQIPAQIPAQVPAAQHPVASATPAAGTPLPPENAPVQPRAAQPLPAEAAQAAAAMDPNSTQGRAFSVRTLGQGVPFTRQAAQVQQPSATATPPPHGPNASGRRRKLGTPPDPATRPEQPGRPQPGAEQPVATRAAAPQAPAPKAAAPQPAVAQPSLAGQSRLAPNTEGAGRSYAIGAPDENAAEGPEPLDGPGGAVEIADMPRPQPMDDELPPEPLDNPRRLLVWPAPDAATQKALSDRGYRPVIVNSREEVDAQIAAFPAALFVDPLTGPITRTALQSLRQAAVAAEVPVLVTAGLGQATREEAYGADPAVLLKALAPRDSEQHPPRVLLVEEHAEIALALTSTLERRGMQVARAASDADAVALAGHFRPNLVVMDLLQVHRRQAGIVDWLRSNGQLNRTPLVVYTAAVGQADLPRLASGETVLFLAERSTSDEVQGRIVDLLARIGTN